MLQDIIAMVDQTKICGGLHAQDKMPVIDSKTVKKDAGGTWRHVACPLIITHGNRCLYDRKAKKTVAKRIERLNKNEAPKKNKITLTPKIRCQWLCMKTRLYSSMRKQKLAVRTLEELRKELEICQLKVARIKEQKLTERLDTRRISNNQFVLLEQMPIAVFASKGPVKGDILAPLIMKAIVLMEGAGAKIHGVITDGARTNRKFWSNDNVKVSSDSVHRGLKILRNIPELRDSEETAEFCKWMNDLFDALNGNNEMQGVSPGNIDYKPPRTGNCSVIRNDSQKPLFTMSDLKSVFAKGGMTDKKKDVLKKLDDMIKNEDWSMEDIVEHDYAKPEITHCLLYCMTSELMYRIMNTEKCLSCQNALLEASDIPKLPEAALTQYSLESLCYHPNTHLFRFILHLESLFQKYCDSKNPFEAILNDVLESNKVSFPCKEHGSQKIMYSI
nr:PREDICTED: uncharacterized protein LOC105272727 [Fopius arisanus]